MRQYFSLKQEHADMILLFRMGDFYEVFFEDAVKASGILNIALTHRGKVGPFTVPMAGIPHHAANTYIDRLTDQSLKVAIAEQVENPKDAVGIVKRAVTRIISPAMPYDLDKSDPREHRFILGCSYEKGLYFIVAIDFTTGDFLGFETDQEDDFLEKIRLLSPKEIVTYMGQFDHRIRLKELVKHYGILPTHLSEEYFNAQFTSIYIEKLIPGYQRDQTLNLQPSVLRPLGALAYYVCTTQKENNYYHLRPFQMAAREGIMKISLTTLTGIEILPKARDSYKNSLLGFLDKTSCPLGSRLLKSLFSRPLDDAKEIGKRQKLVEFFYERIDALTDIRQRLGEVRDVERILAKISAGKAIGGDVLSLAKAIDTAMGIDKDFPHLPKEAFLPLSDQQIEALARASSNISTTINDEIGASLDKGNLIKDGAHAERDRLAHIRRNASEEIANLERGYRKETGIQTLKVKSNNIAGYFIEVGRIHSSKVPDRFRQRQTLVNAQRYTTTELEDFEHALLTAEEDLERIERELFSLLLRDISGLAKPLLTVASNIALIDCFANLAWIALREKFTKPTISHSKGMELTGAWHPLIKSSLQDTFVAHDISLDERRFFALITGPNMAGKTTVMREVAIVQILSQIGSFVPAAKAKVGLCDHLFSRLGASDDILKGQSTFMVEMSETAEIVRHATDRSLVILDEVGRGTSTYDGLSIAWALVEYLIDNVQSTTLFATHYHELIRLIDAEKRAKNLTVDILDRAGRITFLYRLVEGAANQSFGIHVAGMAGLPQKLLRRAADILEELENKKHADPGPPSKSRRPTAPPSVLEQSLRDIDPLSMTPLEAIQKLADLKHSLPPQQ